MIPRYSRKEMEEIWELKNKFQIWLDIECHACDKMSDLGLIPKKSSENIRKKAKFDISRIEELELETKHDVVAFLKNLTENIGEDGKFLHQGMTSSDILDTTFSIQLKQASNIIIKDIEKLLISLKQKSLEHKLTPIIGRSHGIHAEKTTFGIKLAGYYAEFKRNLERMRSAQKEISTCALSGPVGNFASIDPKIEEYVANKFGLVIEPISTQVIPRDRHAVFFTTLGVISASIERLVTEIRNLQRTEIREVEEFFSEGQTGSSAMPHKRNPILSENLTGLARYIRANVIPALENVSLWHERDISHSSLERIIAPDSTIVLNFSLNRLNNIIKNLVVYPENMEKNIKKLKGLHASQYVLLALIDKGLDRNKAYRIVQEAANLTMSTEMDFIDSLLQNNECKNNLNKKELENIINGDDYKKNINLIFNRVYND